MAETHIAIGTERQPEKAPALGAATGRVRTILRLEGLALFGGAVAAYLFQDYSLWFFALLALAPDLTFLAYLAGPRIGATLYNAAHSTLGPIALGVAAHALGEPTALATAIVWAAHIGFDRMLGYGLKYPTGFSDTHLGPIGRNRQ